MNLDILYKQLFDAQLDKNWGKVAKIQLEINKHPESRREEIESPLGEDQESIRTLERTV